jgi:hypothetical protein
MVGGLSSGLVGAIAGCALVCGALVSPTTALSQAAGSAAAPSTLLLEPAVSIVGERPRLSGRAPGPARRLVKLQVRRYDGTWRTIDRRLTRGDRTFGFRLDPVRSSSATMRVVAPSTERAAPWRSARHPVRGVLPQVELVVPTEVRAGDAVAVTAVVAPARAGTPVHLLVGDEVVDTGVQDSEGYAVLTLDAPSGVATLRARVPLAGGASSVTSAPVQLYAVPAVSLVPRVDIVTEDGGPITSKTAYARATFSVDPRGSGVPAYSESARLRVRGNFTATALEKLPYRIKLDDSEELVGLPTSKDWVLLANFYDRSLLRTTLGMEAARRLGLPWSPRFVDVEVYLNGELKGLYQLGEGIEVDEDRVAIELADEDEPAPDGGYLLEADSNDDSDPRFETTRGLQVYVKDPGDAEAVFVDSVAEHVGTFEEVLYSTDFADPVSGYAALIDVDSFVDWYLVMELVKNVDAGMNNSVYLQRDVGGLLSMGPVWDFDLSGGNVLPWDGTSPEGWFVRHNFYGEPWVPSQLDGPDGHWWYRLHQDPAFQTRVSDRWQEVRASLMTLPAYLDERRAHIADAAERTFAPVEDGGAGMPQEATPSDDGLLVHHATWKESADYLTTWLAARLQWMDEQLA